MAKKISQQRNLKGYYSTLYQNSFLIIYFGNSGIKTISYLLHKQDLEIGRIKKKCFWHRCEILL